MRLVKRPVNEELGRKPEDAPKAAKFTNWVVQFKQEAIEELERKQREDMELLKWLRRL